MAERRQGAAAPSGLLTWGAVLCGALAAMALCAPLLAPHDPAEQLDPAVSRHRPPGTRLAAVARRDGTWMLADRVEIAGQSLRLVRRDEIVTLPLDEVANLAEGGVADRRLYPLGTDHLGRDLASRVLYGARISLAIGLLAALLALVVGTAVGSLAAVGGPLLDTVLMRGVDAMLSFPRLFLLLAVTGFFDSSLQLIVLVLGATSWMGTSRLARAEVKSLLGRDFVLAARATGLRPRRILLRHLLPNSLAPVIVDATQRVGNIILLEAALSYLGLGVQPPIPSWGNLVADGRDALLSAWWVSALPGAALALTVLALNLFGDGLRDRLDPRHAADRSVAAT